MIFSVTIYFNFMELFPKVKTGGKLILIKFKIERERACIQ